MTGVFIDEFVPAAAGFSPSALTFGPDGQMYVGSPESSEVRRYDLQTANYDVFIASGGRIKQPTGVAFGPDGNFYITAVATAEILHYDGKTGQFLGPFVTSGLGGLTGGRAIEWKATTRVCHHSGGNPAKAKTLKIGYLSARDHLAHGDSLGACP
jgi:DNA-binding beta-propeller fold protein YncE